MRGYQDCVCEVRAYQSASTSVNPTGLAARKGEMWKLLKLPYSMRDARRQWILKMEELTINYHVLEWVFGVPKIFVKREE